MKAVCGLKRGASVAAFVACTVIAGAAESPPGAAAGGDLTHRMMVLMLQLAVIIIVAKSGGVLFRRVLRLPDVLGELTAGIIISPFALGPYIFGLFPAPELATGMAVSPELYGIATLASILLLYLAGLETDLALFLRYSIVGSLVGVTGVVVSFVSGAVVAVWWGMAESFMSPAALFLGTISTATSVGITARILGERRQLHKPEGVTILAGAVVDDVLGIIVLAVVLGIARVADSGGAGIAWSAIALVAGKALGFWLLLTVAGLLASHQIGRALKIFKSPETMAAVSFGLALLLAGIAEKAGLAMILGAYIMGLSLSRADIAHELERRLQPLYGVLISVFFCVMGMMVNLSALKGMVVFGLIYTLAAILAKVIGCAIPPMLMGFNLRGGLRIGVGMLPRGEVALIIAGIGLSSGLVSPSIFGVVIMMTLVTTFLAPMIMVRIFDDTSGLREGSRAAAAEASKESTTDVTLTLPREEIADFLLTTLLRFFRQEGCYVYQVAPGEPLHRIRQEDISITADRQDCTIILSCSEEDQEYARLMLMEAVADLVSLFNDLRKVHLSRDLRNHILLSEE